MTVRCLWCEQETEYLTVDQAAKALQIPAQTVRRWIREGRLKAETVEVRHRKEYRLREAQILALIYDADLRS